uniref:Uncharacterized protein n=1 Tax=Anguilla anguilla TaxID=7936 RepID=A0A0E9XXC9_ANGAN
MSSMMSLWCHNTHTRMPSPSLAPLCQTVAVLGPNSVGRKCSC